MTHLKIDSIEFSQNKFRYHDMENINFWIILLLSDLFKIILEIFHLSMGFGDYIHLESL